VVKLLHRIIVVLGGLAVLLTALVSILEDSVVDWDLWGALAMGRETLMRGWPPLQDPFSYVPTLNPVVYHEWLTGVLFYLMLEHLGAWSFQALRVALALATLALAALAGRLMGASLLTIGVILFTVLPTAGQGDSPVRAQMFTFLLFSLYILLLEEADRGRRRLLWLLPPIGWIWANLHGGFVAGVALIFLYIVAHLATGKRAWDLIGAWIATILVSLLNPYGVHYWSYLVRSVPMPRPHIDEWGPVPLDILSFWGFKALLVLAVLTVFATARRHWPGLVVLAATAGLAFRHHRHIPFFVIAATAYLSPPLTPLLGRLSTALRARAAVRPLVSAVLVVSVLATLDVAAIRHLGTVTSWRLRVPSSYYPVGAVEFIRINRLKGNLATPFTWGEYVLWRLYPQVRVSLDGRYETVYPEQVSADGFSLLYGLPGWRRLLDQYPTDMVLVDKAYEMMARVMREATNWAAVYEDAVSVIYLPTARSQGSWIHPLPREEGSFP
jgi:hypothetical protein